MGGPPAPPTPREGTSPKQAGGGDELIEVGTILVLLKVLFG